MKKILVLILIVLSSCQNQKKQSIADSALVKKEENSDQPIKERVWLRYDYEEESVMDEVYVFSDSDSLVNQSKVFRGEKLDTLKSHFYDLNFVRENDSMVKVNLNYFSDLYVDHKNEIDIRRVSVYYVDRSADSIVHTRKNFDNVPVSDLVVNFYLQTKEAPILNGLILEEIVLKKEGNEENTTIRGFTYIDNDRITTNPYDIRKYLNK